MALELKARLYVRGPGVLLVKTARGEVQALPNDVLVLFPSGWIVFTPEDLDLAFDLFTLIQVDPISLDPLTDEQLEALGPNGRIGRGEGNIPGPHPAPLVVIKDKDEKVPPKSLSLPHSHGGMQGAGMTAPDPNALRPPSQSDARWPETRTPTPNPGNAPTPPKDLKK